MHEQIAEFLRYWVQLRGTKELPTREQIDPLTIPRRLLPKVHLMTFDEARQDIRFTLVGSEGLRASGEEITGTFVSDLPNRINGSREAYADHVRDLYLSARRFRRPVHSSGAYHWTDGQAPILTERITCPIVARDGTTVEFTGIQVFERQAAYPYATISSSDQYVIDFADVLHDPDAAIA